MRRQAVAGWRALLLHDSTLQRTTSGHGPADALPWSELARLDAGGWHSRAYAGEPLPSFDAIARFCLRNSFALDLEIKPSPGSERITGEVVAAAADAQWTGHTPLPLLTSFRPDALEGARQAAPRLPRGLLLDTLRDGWLDEARSLECVAVVTNYSLIDANVLARIHGAGLRALVYTVNDPAAAHRLHALGIDGIVTDAVDRFSPATVSSTDAHATRLSRRRARARRPRARLGRRRHRVEAEQRLEREAGAFGDPPAADVVVVHADLDSPGRERVEGHARQRDDRFGDDTAAGATGPAPVADLEAAREGPAAPSRSGRCSRG